METVSDFIFGGSKITADADCSREIKRLNHLYIKVKRNIIKLHGDHSSLSMFHLVFDKIYNLGSLESYLKGFSANFLHNWSTNEGHSFF